MSLYETRDILRKLGLRISTKQREEEDREKCNDPVLRRADGEILRRRGSSRDINMVT